MSSHTRAILQALFVAFLWSTSWVLIKIGLEDVKPLTFAGLRYGLAFMCLLPMALRKGGAGRFRHLDRADWRMLILLGLVFYTLTQGAQFVGLDYLPPVTLSLMLNFTSIVVALAGIPLLGEYPGRMQWGGIGLFVLGVLIYFYPVDIPSREVFGLFVGAIGVLANAGSSIMGRSINRGARLPAIVVTTVSMGVGSGALLVIGIFLEGFPALDAQSWLIVIWLALVNTAFAFTLWNHTLRELSAVESSVINNTMLVQIAVLAWIFLDERITLAEGAGLLLAATGILTVQLFRSGQRMRPVVVDETAQEAGD